VSPKKVNAALPTAGDQPAQGSPAEVAAVQARLRRLVTATQAVADELTLPLVHRRIAESARLLVDAEHVALGVLSTTGAVLQLVQLDAREEDAATVIAAAPELAGLTDLAARLPAGRVSRFSSGELQLPLPGDWSDGLLALPVSYRGEQLAVLMLSAPTLQEPRIEDDDALLTLTTTAGIAIEKARLYDEARRRQEAGRVAVELGTQLISSGVELEAHASIAQAVRQLTAADLVVWWRLAEGDTVEVVAAEGVNRADLDGHEVPRTGFSPSVLEGDRATLTSVAVAGEGPFAVLLRQAEIQSLLLLPVVGLRGSRGWVLCGRRSTTTGFSALDLDIGEIFIIQMGVTLDLVAAQAMQERMLILEDRERIGRDLHDNVIQSLFAIGLSVKSAGTLPGAAERGKRLDRVVVNIDDAIGQLRATIFGLNSADPAPAGVQAAVLQVAQSVAPQLGFAPDVSFDGPLDILVNPLIAAELLAVLREAATNVARHSSASRLSIVVGADSHTLSLTVIDNGRGLGSTTRRSGLDNIRMRAELLQGELVLEETGGGGLTLRWSVPLEESPALPDRPTSRRRS
jgi:signal transduction histidine kinase